jgi:hypothetical protein
MFLCGHWEGARESGGVDVCRAVCGVSGVQCCNRPMRRKQLLRSSNTVFTKTWYSSTYLNRGSHFPSAVLLVVVFRFPFRKTAPLRLLGGASRCKNCACLHSRGSALLFILPQVPEPFNRIVCLSVRLRQPQGRHGHPE